MSDYVVSARKYRPKTFETLIGQDNIAKTLKNSIQRGQLAHAYLFCGPRGVGKTSAARIFAKTINCLNPGEELSPCGECESCMSFKEGRSYCIHELDAASNNGVDDIKSLMDQVQIPPQVGRYSVYIIDEVHMLSTSAFNAFLKTLEEPPAHSIFILATTEKHKILPTILSRCQTYDFNRIGIPDIVSNLRGIAGQEGVKIDDESLHVIAQKADGAMRDALTIFDQTVAFCGTEIKYEDVLRNLNVLDYEYCFRLTDSFLAGDYANALLIFDEILSKGFNALYFISALGSHLRDLLVSRTGGLDSLLNLPDSLKKRYARQAAACSVKFLYEALEICSQCESSYRTSSNQRLHMEFSMMKMAFLNKQPSAEQVVAPKPVVTEPKAPESKASEIEKPEVPEKPQLPATPKVSAKPATSEVLEKLDVATTHEVQPKLEIHSAPEVSVKSEVSATPKGSSKQSAIPEPTENPAEKPRKTTAAGIASKFSMSSLLNEQETEDAAEEVVESKTNSLSEEEIMAKWKELPAIYDSQPRLASALEAAKLRIVKQEGDNSLLIEFSVFNEAQLRWIEDKILRQLETNFCKLAGSKAFKLQPYVLPSEEIPEEMKYTPAQKAEDLMNKNEEVRNLVKDLALELN